MRTVLYHQSKSSTGKDILIINSEISEYFGHPEQKAAFEQIKDITQPKNRVSIPFWLGSISYSKSLRLYIDKEKGVVLSSNFKSVDDKGRQITFTFFTQDYSHPSNVAQLLIDYATLAKMEVNPSDVQVVEKSLNYYLKRGTVVSLICAAAFLLLACVLCDK